MESLEIPPSALTRLLSRLSIFPSAESFIVEVLLTLPLVFSVISHVLASTVLAAMVMPQGVMLSLPSVLKVYDWPSMVAFISPPGICSYVTEVSPKSLLAAFIFHLPT